MTPQPIPAKGLSAPDHEAGSLRRTPQSPPNTRGRASVHSRDRPSTDTRSSLLPLQPRAGSDRSLCPDRGAGSFRRARFPFLTARAGRQLPPHTHSVPHRPTPRIREKNSPRPADRGELKRNPHVIMSFHSPLLGEQSAHHSAGTNSSIGDAPSLVKVIVRRSTSLRLPWLSTVTPRTTYSSSQSAM